jgi:exonuclease SbcC
VKINRVRAHPFGCLSDKEMSFGPGMNVVLGANEAGKSTLFLAIRHALLATTRLLKSGVAKHLTPYLPASGGDAISVDLEVATPEGSWLLKRRWGAHAGSELTLPKGATISDEAAVITQIAALLPARPGTVSRILMTRQSELGGTPTLLREDDARESLSDLADILRRAVLETGGVSVDRFLSLLKERTQALLSRWDSAQNGPEKGHGIENPWKKDVGTLLGTWYAAERARGAWKGAVSFEADLDAANAALRTAEAAVAVRDSFVSAHAAAARDARERRTLEAEIGRVKAEAESLRRVFSDWPVAVDGVHRLEESIRTADAVAAVFEREMGEARQAEEARGLRELHARVQRRQSQVAEAEKALATVPALPKASLEEIRRAAMTVEKLEAGLQAGKLSVTIAGRRDVELVVQEDFTPEAARRLAAGETARLRAGGRVRIVHPDMEIEVRSGDADADAQAEKAGAARAALARLLTQNGARDPADAEERCRVYESRAADLAAARKNLSDELAGTTSAELDARIAALGPEKPTRALATIASELATSRERSKSHARELEQTRQKIQEWTAAYGSPEKLMDGMVELKARESAATQKIDRAAPLPQGFADATSFLAEYEKTERELQDLRVERSRLEGDKRSLEARAGDESAEELGVRMASAEEALAAARREAAALKRISDAASALLGAGQTSVFEGVRAGLERILTSLRSGRHAHVEMDGPLPAGLAGEGENTVGWDQLSAGTRDILALALRLSMADYFLGASDGFLMMDDPLVDMDPDRQRAAAAALSAFAEKRQLIVFTCHPATAELLAGGSPAGKILTM